MSDSPELLSATLPTSTWPHAQPHCLHSSPCEGCYCFVCDVPITKCEDNCNHASADGRHAYWRLVKRRHHAFSSSTWLHVAQLVDRIVDFSVAEASQRALTSRPPSGPRNGRVGVAEGDAEDGAEQVQHVVDVFAAVVAIKEDDDPAADQSPLADAVCVRRTAAASPVKVE